MRITADESARLGKIMAEKINAYSAPVTVLLPTKAISIISAENQPFYDPVADEALFLAIKRNLSPDIPVIEMHVEINASEFSEACAQALLENLGKQ